MTTRRVTIGGAFHLVDHDGNAVTDETYCGRYLLIFFGFTHCKMVCPIALAKLSAAMELMGPVADELQPLYITVDPERDSPARMKEFLAAEYPRFTGLTGEPEEIERVKGLYKVFAERAPRADDGDAADTDYDVPHTAMTFLMAPDGTYVTHFPPTATDEQIATKVVAFVGGASDES